APPPAPAFPTRRSSDLGGKSRASNAVSVRLSASGQLSAAAAARSRYSLTVLRATRTLCAIARCDWPAAWSRSTSLILRMDNRSRSEEHTSELQSRENLV